MEVAEFIAKYYYEDETHENIQRVRDLLSYPGIYFAGIPDDGLILVYLTMSDEGLQLLKNLKTPQDFKNGFTEKLLQHPGPHVYVFRMVSDGRHMLRELRRLRAFIMKKHNASSFSWHDNNHILLHTHEA